MKKTFTLVLIALMSLAFSVNALAGTIYLELPINGEIDDDGVDFDLSGTIIGIELPTNNFKAGFEYFNGSIDIGPFGEDLTQIRLKGGYRFADGLYATLEMIDGEWENVASYDSIMFGLDLSKKITKELLLEGSVAFSLTGSVDYDYYRELDADFLSLKGKLTYFFTNNLGGSVGYRKSIIEDEEDYQITTSGITLGATYKF